MTLEATMIIVDNSESSRNGDYLPTRFDAQADAINLIHSAKTQANPESSVGLMSMGGNGPEVLVTFTVDIGQILEGLHRSKIRGKAHLSSSIQVAHLALKHRKEKAQRQRIIVFNCSRVEEDEKSLVKLARKMKKHNVNVDFVVFGDLDSETTKKIKAFHDNVNSTSNSSHMEIIHPGPNLLSDSLIATPIIGGEAMGGREGDEGGNGFEFGIDPSADPELAFALRMSLEEEKARQEKEKQEQEKQGKENLEGIPEESQPLLGEESSGGYKKDKGNDGGKKDKGNDGDKMDTS
ncbi:proteasome regulatory particle base subunit rpn10 [Ophidiomyces ophidiicola]|nr:proteasome regulatory particle base subunit rpn10 [Ophidiomyces ophidiicola]